LPTLTPPTDACDESNEEALVIKAGTVAAMDIKQRYMNSYQESIADQQTIPQAREGKRNAFQNYLNLLLWSKRRH
jgi:hypothetical protein